MSMNLVVNDTHLFNTAQGHEDDDEFCINYGDENLTLFANDELGVKKGRGVSENKEISVKSRLYLRYEIVVTENMLDGTPGLTVEYAGIIAGFLAMPPNQHPAVLSLAPQPHYKFRKRIKK